MKEWAIVMATIVAVSGYFDPIHVGHLEYLQNVKARGGKHPARMFGFK